jgi:hypothetical protein
VLPLAYSQRASENGEKERRTALEQEGRAGQSQAPCSSSVDKPRSCSIDELKVRNKRRCGIKESLPSELDVQARSKVKVRRAGPAVAQQPHQPPFPEWYSSFLLSKNLNHRQIAQRAHPRELSPTVGDARSCCQRAQEQLQHTVLRMRVSLTLKNHSS